MFFFLFGVTDTVLLGTLDIYCYACNDARLDNDLSTHLANWGINIAQQTKTEKSMTELVKTKKNDHYNKKLT